MYSLQEERRTTSSHVEAYRSRLFFLLVSGAIVVADQLSKIIVRLNIPVNESLELFNGDLIWFWHLRNSGTAFGLKLLPPTVLILISIMAVLGISVFFLINHNINSRLGLPLALFLGGALGNLIDRLYLGEVVDFISINLPDFIMWRWPAFNVADASLTIGVFLMIIFSPSGKTAFYGKTQVTGECDEK